MNSWKAHIREIETNSRGRHVLARRQFNAALLGGGASKWMVKAANLARGCDAPFAALIVDRQDNVVASGKNQYHSKKVMHAELDALLKLSPEMSGLTMYTTAEPCPMCMSAVVWSGQIDKVIYGTSIPYLIERGYPQINIRAVEIVERTMSGGGTRTRLLVEQAGEETTNVLYN